MDFESLIKFWRSEYFTELFLLIVEISALIILISKRRNSKIGKLFIIYVSFDLLILFISYCFTFKSDLRSEEKLEIFSLFNVLVANIELVVYFLYFNSTLQNKKIRSYLFYSAIAFTILSLIYILSRFNFLSDRPEYFSFLLGCLEFILVLPPCIVYYIELFKKVNSIPLSKRPSFWIITGIFFYCLISIPYFLANQYIFQSKSQYNGILIAIFFNIPFAINFIFLIIAALCKKAKMTF